MLCAIGFGSRQTVVQKIIACGTIAHELLYVLYLLRIHLYWYLYLQYLHTKFPSQTCFAVYDADGGGGGKISHPVVQLGPI